MTLAREDFEDIGEYIQKNMSTWLANLSHGQPPAVYEIELRERIIRVEEGMKNQIELMRQGFAQIDKRLEISEREMNKRFEQVDKRFEQIDKRFESFGQRMDSFMRWSFGVTLTVGGLVVAAIKYLP